MPTPIDGVEQLDNKAVNRLAQLRITTMEQLLPRIMLANSRRNLEMLLGAPLDGVLGAFDGKRILAGIPNHHAATGALIPAGTGSGGSPSPLQPTPAGALGGVAATAAAPTSPIRPGCLRASI